LPAENRAAFLTDLSADETEFLHRQWRFWAREHQLAPESGWRIWLFMGGRGAGKTRAGAEWILEGVREGRMNRVALVGATYADVRDVMILGESGLLTLARDEGVVFEPSKRLVSWPEGALAHVFTAEEPDGLRGHQFDGAWADGKKTYIVALIAALTAGAQALGITIPDFVYAIEAALGLGALRVAVTKTP
jgi:phage terminase large subunit-like protein